ncbi:MAG: PD-(D/E)XK nuclease family protein, partial [Chloroflexi bacterium]|nr:PD-(D/E)XK nuclease family protein [Chloroflexota bacterium]
MSGLMKGVLEAFARESLRYCVLRDADCLARHGGEVDLLVDRRDLARLPKVLGPLGFVRVRSWGSPHRFFLAYDRASDAWLKLDVIPRLAYGHIPVLGTSLTDRCLKNRRCCQSAFIPSPEDELVALLLHCVLEKRRFEPLRRDQAAVSFIEAFKSIVADYFDPDDDVLMSVIDEVDQLGTVGAVGGEFSLDNFAEALRANLELAFTRERGLGDGVVIAEYRVAGGLEFRRVILCGAFEGALPAGPGGDAILDDRVWQSLRDEHPFIEDATTRIKRARESAERAIGAAAGGHLTWSAPSYEPGGAREYYPSPMMAEAYSAVTGRRVSASQLRAEASSEDVAHPRSALGSMLAGPVVDAAELGLRDAVRSAQAGAAIPEDDPRARPLALLRARRSGVFTEWDGNVAEIDADLLVGPGKKVSPTSLETYGACGYRYFARSVLRLNVVDEPDEREMMDAAERGSVIHRVLERFFLHQQERGRPAVNETWTAADEKLLLQIADEELANAAARGQTGLEVYSKHEVRTIGSDLRQFLLADNAFRQETGAVPAEFEQAIPETEIAGVTLRGRVDRIDRTPDGRAAWVIDYKTGSTWEFRDLISG